MRRLALLVLALAVAGCAGADGGSPLSKADYQREVKAAGEEMAARLDDLSDATANASTPQEVAEPVGDVEQSLRAVADDLDELEPPADAAAPHDRLVAGIRGIADDLGRAREGLERGDANALARFGEEFPQSEAALEVQAASEELKAKGYRLG